MLPAQSALHRDGSMNAQVPWSSCISCRVGRARDGFRFMAAGQKQSNWTMRSRNRRRVSVDIFAGPPLFDGTDLPERPVGREEHPRCDCSCGSHPEALTWPIGRRIVPGEVLELGTYACLINTIEQSSAAMDSKRWEQTGHVWQAEIRWEGCIHNRRTRSTVVPWNSASEAGATPNRVTPLSLRAFDTQQLPESRWPCHDSGLLPVESQAAEPTHA
jgi:hypothetical protein